MDIGMSPERAREIYYRNKALVEANPDMDMERIRFIAKEQDRLYLYFTEADL